MRKYVDGMVDPRQGKFDSGDGLIIFSRNRGAAKYNPINTFGC